MIVVNKWDLVKKSPICSGNTQGGRLCKLPFIEYAPIIFVSAKTSQRVLNIFDLVIRIHQQYIRRIQTSDLNTILELIVRKHPPPIKSGRPTRIYYGSQVVTSPPTFVFMTNNPDKTNSSYDVTWSINCVIIFGFQGTPLEIIWRKRTSKFSKPYPAQKKLS